MKKNEYIGGDQNDDKINKLLKRIKDALVSRDNPLSIILQTRVSCEAILKLLYIEKISSEVPDKITAERLKEALIQKGIIPSHIVSLFESVQRLGNKAAHVDKNLTEQKDDEALVAENCLGSICNWYMKDICGLDFSIKQLYENESLEEKSTPVREEKNVSLVCAVSGKHLKNGIDSFFLCPQCKKNVDVIFYNKDTFRCQICEDDAKIVYKQKVEQFLANGIIEYNERKILDELAIKLKINKESSISIEAESRKNRLNASHFQEENIRTSMSGFHSIQFKKIIDLIFSQHDLTNAYSGISSIYRQYPLHEDASCLYFLIKAIYSPSEFIQEYESDILNNSEAYWEEFWSFLPYLKQHNFENGFRLIEENKRKFSDRTNEIFLSEVIAYFLYYSISQENDAIEIIKSRYFDLVNNFKFPLLLIYHVIGRLLESEISNWEKLEINFDTQEKFIFNHILKADFNKDKSGQIRNKSTTHSKGSFSDNEPGSSLEFDQSNSCFWVDKAAGLKVLENSKNLVYHDTVGGKDYPTFFTNRAVWLAKSIRPYIQNVSSGLNSSSSNNYGLALEKYLPKGWLIPTELDLYLMRAFFESINGENKYNILGIRINDDICFLGDELVAVDSSFSRVIMGGQKFILAGFSGDKISLFSIDKNSFVENNMRLIYFSKERFKLINRLKHNNDIYTNGIFGSLKYSQYLERSQSSNKNNNNLIHTYGIIGSLKHSQYLERSQASNKNNNNLVPISFFDGLPLVKISNCEFKNIKIIQDSNNSQNNNRIFYPLNSGLIKNLISINFPLPSDFDFSEYML